MRKVETSPHPEGTDLHLRTRCFVDASHRRPRTHPIVLHPDWSVDTGHDLESERIAVAFGGYLSCLDLVDKVVPAARTYLLRPRSSRASTLGTKQPVPWS